MYKSIKPFLTGCAHIDQSNEQKAIRRIPTDRPDLFASIRRSRHAICRKHSHCAAATLRSISAAGLANDVLAVNQYAAPI